MKRWTWGPEEAVGGRKRDLRAFIYANLRGKTRAAVKQRIVLRCVVAQVRHLLVLSIAITAEDKGFARVVVPAVVRRDRLFVNG